MHSHTHNIRRDCRRKEGATLEDSGRPGRGECHGLELSEITICEGGESSLRSYLLAAVCLRAITMAYVELCGV